jgi:hypothetical protein
MDEKRVRLVKVWAVVQTRAGNRVTVRMVREATKGIQFVNAIRELGFRAGYDWQFRGKRMSTPAQKRLLFAVVKAAGYVEPKEEQQEAAPTAQA